MSGRINSVDDNILIYQGSDIFTAVINQVVSRNRQRTTHMKNIKKLIEKGANIPSPESVYISDEVNADRISGQGVTIYPGCKIFGSSTLILRDVILGYEAPATVEGCQIGPEVSLKGGFFKEAVFLKKSEMGSGAHVREGTILEEEASGAHTVGLKQAILFPFVTLGSLINFCDCFMAGGTDRKNHSEVGSSYIHFNYTPSQDKATPSLIGDVPEGVMLNQPPIFLGGQGGLVGPCRLAYGTVIAAGSICRKDELRPGRLIFEGGRSGNIPFSAGGYLNIHRILENNVIYIANLNALMQWYQHIRSQFISDDFPETLLDALKEKLNMGIKERIGRLKKLCQNHGNAKWPELEETFKSLENNKGDISLRDAFSEKIQEGIRKSGKDYIGVIAGLEKSDAEIGTRWLRGIVMRDA
ncbi:protein GlmU [Desulfococcaceae bacterium HSG8]|nr:protein GlmU [Desulfococcaceae bacterium HSG8]